MRNLLPLGALVLGALLFGGVAARAHHSFAAEYFEDQMVSLEGEVTEFQYRNPHAWVMFRVQDPQGQMAVYSAEWVGAGRLGQQGITADVLKPGDLVKISGSPGRNASQRRLHLKGIERPADGWTWANRGRRR